MAKFTVEGKTICLDVLPSGQCACRCGALVLRKNMHRHLSTCDDFLKSPTEDDQYELGASHHKDSAASSPPLQDSDSGLIFETRLQLTVIDNVITLAMANVNRFLEGQKKTLKRKLEEMEEVEELQEQRKALAELQSAAEKAKELSREMEYASRRVRVLARELGVAAERAMRIYDSSATTNPVTPDPASADPAEPTAEHAGTASPAELDEPINPIATKAT